MTKPNHKSRDYCKILSKWWFVIILFVFIAYFGIKQTYKNHILRREGKCISAIVYKRESYGGKGKVNTQYRFEWNGQIYNGSSSLDDKYRKTDKVYYTNDDLIIGDTIIIVFLESNPQINKSNSVVKKDCGCLPQ